MENEHTALNGTTITTTTTEKKGYTPLVVWFTFTATLLLGLAFYAGQPIRSSYRIGGRLVLPVVPSYPLDKPDICTNPDKCECASCHWYKRHPADPTSKVCTPPSETVHCPATGPACSTTARVFSGDDSDCTKIIANYYGYACNEIVARMKMNFVSYNCMDDPSSPWGRCANQNVCEYA